MVGTVCHGLCWLIPTVPLNLSPPTALASLSSVKAYPLGMLAAPIKAQDPVLGAGSDSGGLSNLQVRRYGLALAIRSELNTPKLEAIDTTEQWSLRSWSPLTYVGGRQLIDVRASSTPKTWEDITRMAEPFIEAAANWPAVK